MNTLYINYTKTGNPISDHLVEENIRAEADFCKYDQDKQFNVSTENVIAAARAMKLTGKIICDLKILFEGKELPMNEYCVIQYWPHGFCDYVDRWNSELLTEQVSKKRKANGL